MLNKQLINPASIVVVGGSNDLSKPRGKVLKNIIDGGYNGKLYVTNTKESIVQRLHAYRDVKDLPEVELAVIAVPSKFIADTMEVLATQKNTKAFIVISAGFSEESEEGRKLEQKLVEIVNRNGACLIGPNCTGIITPYHHSIFTYPIPKMTYTGCDLISGSGATACFILESGITKGLTFANIFSVGNSAQNGVEDVLEYMDKTFDADKDSKVKLLYLENVSKPDKLLKHASSLIRKGCKIGAIKAGSSDAGSRAASSHTGALATSDVAVDALLRKSGIVRCLGREELIGVASVFMHKELKGRNIAVITHAGGPAVMLTDALSLNGMNVPKLDSETSRDLLTKLFPGSSTANPIDFLATGTAEQLATIIDYADSKFDDIDGMVVIYGSPGLFKIYDSLDVIDRKIKACKKPLYPVMPSVVTAADELKEFLAKGRINFPDPIMLGNSIAKVYHTPKPADENPALPEVDVAGIRAVIDGAENGYLSPDRIQSLLDAVGIPRVNEIVVKAKEELTEALKVTGYPVVMKVVGPIHKTDVGGVVLGVNNEPKASEEFSRMMKIKDATGILIQPMVSGIELFAGAKFEAKFGHMVLCGLGGIFIEVLKDITTGLGPLSKDEALSMIKRLKAYKIIQGVRGRQGVNENLFADIIVRLSVLLKYAPEIMELDLNPLIGRGDSILAVDARISVEKFINKT